MIPRYTSLRPKTMKEYYESRDRAALRRTKRLAKRRELGFGPERTTVKAQIDHIVSLIVRRRDWKAKGGLCLVCVVKEKMCILKRSPLPIQLAYHIVPRGDAMTRWDLRNMVGACAPCNQGELWSRAKASTKALYRRIHVELLGGGEIGAGVLHDLEYLATQTLKLSTADLIAKRDELKAHLEGK